MFVASLTMKQQPNLLAGPIDRSLRLFAIPMAFSFLVNMVYSLIDRYYASRLGDEAIAAIGSSDQITFFLFTLVSGLAVGTGIIVARRYGEGDRTGANNTATQGVVGIAVLALLVSVSMYIVMPTIPSVMRMDPEVSVLAFQYMSTLYLGFAANLVSFQIFSIVRSTGNPVFPMVVLIGTTVLNALLAPFLIFGIGPFPQLGLAGAGLATALAQISGACAAIWAVTNGRANVHISFRNYRPDVALLGRVAALGFPSAIQMLSVSVNRAIMFVLVGGFGTSVTAAYTLGLNMDMLVFMSVFAMGVAVEVATGQNLGAKQPERAAAYHRSAVKQMTVLMLSLAIAIWLLGEYFIRLYTSTPSTVEESLRYLRTTIFGYVGFAIGLVTVRAISGAGAAYVSMLITAGSLLLIQLPLAHTLAFYFQLGPQGVWLGIVIGYTAFALIALLIYRMDFWRNVTV